MAGRSNFRIDAMTQHLTDVIIKQLPLPAKGSKVHYDAVTKGFGISVTAAGARSFVLNYRVKGTGRERRITIGRYPDWMTTAARSEAQRLRRLIDQGSDPLGDLEDQRSAPTMADLIDRFVTEHVEPRLRPQTKRAYKILLELHIRPAFRHLKVNDVTYTDVDALHRRITDAGSPTAANRCVGVMSKMFALAVRWNMRDDNPCRSVEKNSERKRKRYLSGDELTRLTTALATFPNRQIADIIRMLLLTGARRGEVESMRWADVDLTAGIWTKPGSTTKQKTDHTVPLSAPARQLLSEIRTVQTTGTFVFPSEGVTGHVVELARAWRRLCKSADIEGLHIHDLRHSFASQLASSGATLPLIGALLGHSNPTSTARYTHLFQDPQRAAVERVAVIVDGKPVAEVIDIKGGRRG
jgi:integrase